MDELLKMFQPECCRVDIPVHEKDEVLAFLADLVLKHPGASGVSRDTLIDGLKAREQQGSTGIGNQMAIPHCQVEGLSHFIIALGTSHKGVDFDSIDGKKARLFLTIIGPEGMAAEHLKILAGISRTLAQPGVKAELLAAPTELALYEAFVSRTHPEGVDALKKREEMSLLTLILFDKELIYNILEMFLQNGIEGATITESVGMGEYISNVPLFAGFLGFMNDQTNKSSTIQVIIPTELINRIVEDIESITGDLDKKQGAALFVSPIQLWKGSMKMM